MCSQDPIKMIFRDGILSVENFYYILNSGKIVLGRQNVFYGTNYLGSIVEINGEYHANYYNQDVKKFVREKSESYESALVLMLEPKVYLKVFPIASEHSRIP